MDRKEFLSLLGFSSASIAVAACLGGCTKDIGGNSSSAGNTAGSSSVDFTLDLTQSANAALKTNGGYIYSNGVIVARTLNGDYIAVQQFCTHERYSLIFQGSAHRFYCGGHGATFSESGAVTGGPAPRSLTQYKTSLNGDSLRVYSGA